MASMAWLSGKVAIDVFRITFELAFEGWLGIHADGVVDDVEDSGGDSEREGELPVPHEPLSLILTDAPRAWAPRHLSVSFVRETEETD